MDTTIVQTGFKLAQAVIANGSTTGNPWTNPDNLLLVDGDVAESNPGASASDVTVGNFNLNLPQGAVPTGIELKIFGYRGAQTAPVITLSPFAVDNTSGEDVFYPYTPPFTGLTPDSAEYILGSSTYMFATEFTVDQINNLKIQLVANGDMYIDAVQMNAFYYVPGSITPPAPSGDSCSDCNSPIQAQPFYLALPFYANQTKCVLKSFNYPDGSPILFEDLGACGGYIDLTFDPAVPKTQGSNFEENAFVGIWTVLDNGFVELDFVTLENRGLAFHTPYGHDDALLSDHDANSMVIISNSGHYEDRFLRKCQIGVLVSAPIEVDENSVLVTKPATIFNFTGPGVSVVEDGTNPEKVNINIPGVGGTNPAVIVSTTSSTTGSTPELTLTADLDISGLNRGAIVNISGQQSKTIVTVTVGGVSCTREVTATDTPNDLRNEQWVCVNPPLGSQPVIVTWSAPTSFSFGAECVNGIDVSTPVGATQSATGSSLTPTLALTTMYDNSIIIDGLATAKTPILYTPGPGQASNWSETANADLRQGGSSVQETGLEPDAITMQYAITQNTPWVYTALEIKGITTAFPPSAGVATVTDDGNTVVVVNNTDPANPVIEFDGVHTGSGISGNGTSGSPLVATGAAFTAKVAVDASDTTPNYLTDKISMTSADSSVVITPSITSPGGNEVQNFDLSVSGGGASGPYTMNADETETTWFTGTIGRMSNAVNIGGWTTTFGAITTGSDWSSFAPTSHGGSENGSITTSFGSGTKGLRLKFFANLAVIGNSNNDFTLTFANAVLQWRGTWGGGSNILTFNGVNVTTPLNTSVITTPSIWELVWDGTNVHLYIGGTLRNTSALGFPGPNSVTVFLDVNPSGGGGALAWTMSEIIKSFEI